MTRRYSILTGLLVAALTVFSLSAAFANVTVTPATGGTNISADKAANGSSTFTTLGNIVITEGAKGDFATSVTQLVLHAPTGWTFQTSGVTAVATGGNVTVGTISYTSTTITIPLTVGGTNRTDVLTVSGVAVKAADGANVPGSGNITPTFNGTITGLTTSTNLGSLSQTFGAMTKLVVTLPGQSFTDGTTVATSGNSGAVTAQAAGISFNIGKLTATDQFFNIVTSYTGAHTISYTGPANAPTGAAPTYTTAVSFTSGQSTTALATTLTKAETTTITASDGTTTGPASSGLTVNPGAADATQSTLTPTNASITANGSTQILTVTAKDAYGNTLTTGGASVTITKSSGTGTISLVTDSLNGTYTATVTSPTVIGNGLFVATLGGQPVKSGTASQTQSLITYVAGPATKFVITGTGTQTAGVTQNMLITAEDAYNNTATSYTGSKNLAFSGANSSSNPVTVPTVTNSSGTPIAFGSTTAITFTNGVATVSGGSNGVMTLYKAESATISATDSTISSTGSDRLSVVVSAASMNKFELSLSSPQSNGVAFTGTNTLTAEDAYGNPVTFDASTNNVTIAPVSPLTGAVSGLSGGNKLTSAGDFTGGVANLSSLGMTYTGNAGTGTFTATAATGGYTGTSASVTVTPGAAVAAQSTLTPTSASITADGVSTQILTVTAKDVSGNLVGTGGASVTMTRLTGTGTIDSVTDVGNGTYTATVTAPGATGSGVFVATMGGQPVKSSTGSQTQATITYVPAGLDHFAISGISTTQTAGTAITGISIVAQDVNNNTVTGFTGTVSYSGTAGITGTSAAFASGQLTGVSVTPIASGTGMTFTVSAAGKTGTATFNVNPGALDHFAISAIGSPQTAGTAITGITLTAQDVVNNTVTSFTGTVTYGGSAGITGTSSAFTAGALTSVSVTPTVAGTGMTFIVTGLGKSGTATFDVNPGALDHFAISAIGSPQTAGTAITGITLTAQDIANNTVTSYASTVSYSGTAGITGTSSAFMAGTLTGVSVTPTIAGIGTTFIVTGSGKSGTATFDVNPGAATRLVINGSGTQTAGVTQNLLITAEDAYNNTATSYTGSKSLTFSGANSSSNPVTAPTVTNSSGTPIAFGSTTAITFTNGVATVSGGSNGVMTLYKAESATISATDSTISSTGSDRLSVVVSAASINKFELNLTSPQSNGITFTGTNTLTAEDAYGNPVTFDPTTNNVTIAPVSPLTGAVSGLSGGNKLTSAGDFTGGIANLSSLGMIYTGNAGTGTFTATAATGGYTGTSASVTINPGTLYHFAFVLASPQTNGVGFTGKNTLTAQDISNNTITSFNALADNVTIAANAPLTGSISGLSGTDKLISVSDFTSGVADLTTLGMIYTGSTGTGTFTATSSTGRTGTSGSVTVNASGSGIVNAATGGNAISADTYTSGNFTSLTGPVYTEAASGNAGTGTIILNAPSGFIFDVGGTAPTVLITRISGGGASSRNINSVASGTSAAMTTVTSTQLTFTITSPSNSGVTNSLTWQNIRVRPTAGTPLAIGSITKTGTSVMSGVTDGSTNFGALTEIAGALDHFAISAISSPQTAGVPITGITLTAQDAFNNTATSFAGAVSYSGTAGITGTSSAFTLGVLTGVSVTPTVPGSGMTFIVTGGGKTGTATFDVIGTKTWVGGTDSNWETAANWSPNGVPSTLSEVQFTGSSSITVNINNAGAVCNKLTISNPNLVLNILSPNATLSVTDSLTMSGGTLNTGMSFPSAGTVSITGGTVNYNAALGSQTVSVEAYNNLTISGGGTKTLAGAVNLTGSLLISGGSFDNAGYTVTLANNQSFTVSNGATFIVNGTSGMIAVTGTGATTFGPTSTVDYAGTNQTVSNELYGNLTLSGSGTKTMPASALALSGTLTVSGTASATASAAMTIDGDVVLNSGSTFDAGSFAHTVSGNWTNNGGTFTPGTSTVTFNGTSAQAIDGTAPNQTFNNVVVAMTTGQTLSVGGSTTSLTVGNFTETSGNFTAPTTLSINGTAVLTTGTFTAGATLNIAGNWTKNGATFAAGTGTVNFNGVSAQTISGSVSTSFNILSINNSVGVTLDQTASASVLTIGNVTSNSLFSDGGFQVTLTGTLNLTSGTFRLGSSSTATTYPGFGVSNISAGTTVEYAAGVAQTVSATPTYANLTISGASAPTNYKTAAGNLTVSGALIVNGGNTLDMQADSGSAFGSGSANNGSIRWSGSNVYVAGTGTTEFYGSSAGNIAAGADYGNIWISGSNKNVQPGVSVTAHGGTPGFGVTVDGSISIANTGSLTVTGMDLVNNGTITNNGSITVQ